MAAFSLDTTHIALGWPKPSDVIEPDGPGAAVFASLVREKIGRVLDRLDDAKGAQVGVLMADPNAINTEPPLAVVAEFQQTATSDLLQELHRLSWNFSHSPTLITIEPTIVRVWTCCEAPTPTSKVDDFLVHSVTAEEAFVGRQLSLETSAVQALHWVNLVSGTFFQQHSDRFDRDGRADQMLLGNLQQIRSMLRDAGLEDDDVCHDLLARIIFVQFLFQRTDVDGTPALTAATLLRLRDEGVLSRPYSEFASILSNYDDTYSLFDWLNARFNGDLFPGKGSTAAERSRGWARERQVVKKSHLKLLSDFIRGDIDLPSGQTCLWPQYSFDVIPLEFISSIYEAFVTERGIYYTRPHLVDFILDRVLPWDGVAWDLKVLDPACGSGIFLVKAFQRLAHRWKKAHPGDPIRAENLRYLLERNLFGVDKDPHAVRVASFSLYLAMCDEIEPRHYWSQIVFPAMRDRRLICSDFFLEGRSGFDSSDEKVQYDLVVGNAPWGKNLATDLAHEWAVANEWQVPNNDPGTLFLAKSVRLLKPSGKIAMIQSASSLLFNWSGKAASFRRKLFEMYRIEAIYNLAVLRFKMFSRGSHRTKTSVSPACIVVMAAATSSPDDEILYVTPKQVEPLLDDFSVIVEPHDEKLVRLRDALCDPTVWTTLMWGSSRDRALVRKLASLCNLNQVLDEYEVKTREGVIFGDRKKKMPELSNWKLFDQPTFPTDSDVYLDAASLPRAGDLRLDARASTDFSAFAWPQLIVKQGWQQSLGRFQARLVRSANRQGILCSQSYVTVHGDKAVLDAAYVAFNSKVAAYFLHLTSGRMAAYRPEVQKNEILRLPIPRPGTIIVKKEMGFPEIDEQAYEAFGLKEPERVLIEDLFDFSVERSGKIDRLTNKAAGKRDLADYCKFVIRVLRAGFGSDKEVSAIVFREEGDMKLPYNLVSFQLDSSKRQPLTVISMRTPELLAQLNRLDVLARRSKKNRPGIYHSRVARVYVSNRGQASIFVIKPNRAKYWTRSAGLNDGDEIAADLFRWHQTPLEA